MNNTLDNAKALLAERYRLDSKDAGAMLGFYQRCHSQLAYVCGELEAQIRLVSMLKKDLDAANVRIKNEEESDNDFW